MAEHPHHHSSDQGVSLAAVAAEPPAGLRFLLAEHEDLSGGLLPFVLAARLTVALFCFVGGFVCAQAFLDCLGSTSAACPSVTAFPSRLLGLPIGLLPACAALRLLPPVTESARRRIVPARTYPRCRQPLPVYTMDTRHG